MLFFFPLEPKHCVLSLPELVPGRIHLEGYLVTLTLGLAEVRFQYELFVLQLLFLSRQLLKLVGS